MSLILEALKKLDREKQTPERGVVVLGATAWAARREGRGRMLVWLLIDLALVGLGAAGAVWWLSGSRPPSANPAPVAVASAATTSTPPAATLAAAPYVSAPAHAPAPAGPAVVRTPRAHPTSPPRATPAAASAFVLQAITEQDGIPVALINERVLRVGEGFDGMRVLRISPTEVEIQVEATGARQVLAF